MSVCRCGHRDYDHLGAGRCDEGRKRCGCGLFRECLHSELRPWYITHPVPRTRMVCAVCGRVQDDDAVVLPPTPTNHGKQR